MKKKMIALLAGALMTLSASSAFAYFGTVTGDQFDLVRVVYDTTGSVEVVSDLGNVTTVAGNLAPTFSLSQFGANKSFANLNVAYFAYDNASNSFWGTSTVAPASATNALIQSAYTNAQSVTGLYNTFGTQTVVGNQATTGSYYNAMDKNGVTIGQFAGLLAGNTGEQNLAALASGGSVSMELYKFSITGARSAASITDIMTITTNADGTTTVPGGPATPIPAPFFLMGSGLLGMFGLRRKQKA